MTSRIRVVNTAPLIFLAKLGRLELLRLETDVIYVPSAVLSELRAVPDEATIAVNRVIGAWLFERACAELNQLEIIKQAVDLGEAEAISLALELDAQDIVLDDLDARRFARRSGLHPIGTLGLLLAAKHRGILPAIRPEIEALKDKGFRISNRLTQRILTEAGE